MKRTLLILVTVLLALASCRKEIPVVEEGCTYSLSSLRFEFTIDRLETKGIKSGWENGDKVFIFFSGVNSAYVTMSYNGSAWSSTLTGTGDLSQTGTLTALYLPYVAVTPSFNNGVWSFGSGTNSYFLITEKGEYYIRDMADNPATLGAKLVMTKANATCSQFYVPKTPGNGETMQLACNVVTPTGLASIALDGTVSSSSGVQGAWMTGYPATVATEQGFYFYGTIAQTPGSDNYFALRDNSGTYYKHYYKGSTTLLANKSYQLPDFDNWSGVGEDIYVGVGGLYWCSVNEGAASPLSMGTAESSRPSSNIAASKIAPSSTQWGVLTGNTVTRVPLTVAGVTGVLMIDGTSASQYFFLPNGDYWSSTTGAFFRVGANGTTSLESGTPASAYVRLVVNPGAEYNGDFTDPVDGGEL